TVSDPPARPAVFHSREELMNYVRELNLYFAIVGRPRY
uniref:Neuropeptide Y2-like conopeptide n=1 Tax=Conus betulinus TaxID=89764 RepID=NPY2_CONBE|nr:RecName: Full=Neuropeptide Y2-like conopeptide; Short=Cono-NPY2; Short=NPY2-like conopeptide [Conus betulinus]